MRVSCLFFTSPRQYAPAMDISWKCLISPVASTWAAQVNKAVGVALLVRALLIVKRDRITLGDGVQQLQLVFRHLRAAPQRRLFQDDAARILG